MRKISPACRNRKQRSFRDQPAAVGPGLQITNLNDATQQFLTFFEAYGNTIYVLLSKSADSGFRSRFKESAIAISRKALAGKMDAEQIDDLITYVSSCGLGLIEHWYETGKKYSADAFLRMMQTILSTGIMGYMQGKKNG